MQACADKGRRFAHALAPLRRPFAKHVGARRDRHASLKDLAALLDDPRMCRDMSDGYIDFAAMHREIITVYCIVPLRELTNQAKWSAFS